MLAPIMATSARMGFSRRYSLPSTVTFCLPFSTTVPRPVVVSTPPRPAPAARICSARVPWGWRVTCSSPAFIWSMVLLFVPIWVAIRFFTWWLVISLPTPTSGYAVSLQMMVRSFTPFSTKASIKAMGFPTPRNPPTITVMPSLILSAASFTDTNLFMSIYLFLTIIFQFSLPSGGLFLDVRVSFLANLLPVY